MKQRPLEEEGGEANSNPTNQNTHIDGDDTVVQSFLAPEAMPTPILNFDGIGFPGVSCNCSPPDTNGEVGATQYVQMVNEGYQVFNKSTGVSVLGPSSIVSLCRALAVFARPMEMATLFCFTTRSPDGGLLASLPARRCLPTNALPYPLPVMPLAHIIATVFILARTFLTIRT